MEHLTFEELRHTNLNRCNLSFFPIDTWSEADWGVAIAGEVGEACNFIKKRRRLRYSGDSAISVHGVANELADVVIYADLLCSRMGVRLEDAVSRKFNEVSDRVGSDLKIPERENNGQADLETTDEQT